MFTRGCVTKDFHLLKQFIFHLSLSSMSYMPNSRDSWWQNVTRAQIDEILIFFDNAAGSMSFSVCYTYNGQKHSRHFPNIFINLHKYFKNRELLLYVSFKSIFNSALTIEFLGSCVTDPFNGMEQSLINKSRFHLTQLRAKSAFQKVTKYALQCSSGYAALHMVFPLLARFRHFGDINDILDVRTLVQLYASLNIDTQVSPYRYQKHRLSLSSRYPRHKIFVDRRELNWLHFLTYHVFQYFDGRFPNERVMIRNWEVQTDDWLSLSNFQSCKRQRVSLTEWSPWATLLLLLFYFFRVHYNFHDTIHFFPN